jgi:YD repeat-containing protein
MKPCLRTALLVMFLIVGMGYGAIMQGGGTDPSSSGSSSYPQLPWSSVLKTKAMENSYYQPWGSPGTALHNVNLLTGQPIYSIPIGEISAGSAARFPISLIYTGSMRSLFESDNEKGPTTWVGYGWNFTTPYIAVNHKGTASISDDVYFCNLGPYGGGQLLQNGSGQFYVATDPTIQILGPDSAANGTPSKWTFKWPGGLRMTFGAGVTSDPASRSINMVGSTLTGNPYAAASGTDFTYRWDVARMDDYRTDDGQGNESIEFTYDRKTASLGSTKSYTREAYVKTIVHKNRRGNEIEKYAFVLAPKNASEYRTSEFEPSMAQTIYETQMLSSIERYVEGSANFDRRYNLISVLQAASQPSFPYPKRFLTSIQMQYRNSLGFVIQDPKSTWTFGYEPAANYHALKTIDKPFVGRDEFEYTKPVFNTAAWMDNIKQDLSVRQLAKGDGSVITLPSDPAVVAAQWENQTFCTETFCFITARESNPNDALHFTVFRNNGTYFKKAKDEAGNDLVKTVTSNFPQSLQLIPWNENFIVLDSKGKKIWLYEWNGSSFKIHTDFLKREKPAGTFTTVTPLASGGWNVVLASDYFMIVENGFKNVCNNTDYSSSSKVYIIRKSGADWKDMNERECVVPTSCVRTNPPTGSWTVSPGCLEFHTQNLSVDPGPGLLQISVPYGQNNSYIFAWAQSQSGSAFNFISMYNVPGALVQPIQYGKDYFLISFSDQIGGYVQAFHFNGQAITSIDFYSDNLVSGGTRWDLAFRGYASGDYFVIVNRANGLTKLDLRKKVVTRDANQIPTGFSFASYLLPNPPSGDIVPVDAEMKVRLHPSAFSVEAYPAGSLQKGWVSKPPIVNLSTDNYMTYIYEVDPALSPTPARNVTAAFRDPQNRNLFDVSFSYLDNKVMGTSCKMGGNACTGYQGQALQNSFYTAIFAPGLGGAGQPFFRNLLAVNSPLIPGAAYEFNQFRISGASSMSAISLLNSATHKMDYNLLQWMGQGFTNYPYEAAGSNPPSGNLTLVKSFKSNPAITGSGFGHWTEYGFRFGSDNLGLLSGKAEYNALSQSFIFPSASVVTYKGSTSVPTPVSTAVETIHHIIDDAQTLLPDAFTIEQGALIKSRLHDISGAKGAEILEREIRRVDNEYYNPAPLGGSWPASLYVFRPKSATTTQWARNQSRQTTKIAFNNYYPANNRPMFSKTQVGSDWYLTQNLFQTTGPNQGVQIGSTIYRFTIEPVDAVLNAWINADQAFSVNNTTEKTVSAWESELDATFPHRMKKQKTWRDTDPSLSDAALKTGVEPVFLRSEGWEDRQIIDKWNKVGQPLETRTILSSSPLVERRTALFYEGRSSLPVAVVENSYVEDAAVLTAENGNLSLTAGKHDWEDRWSAADAGYSSDFAHTGRWSIKVVDNYGPTIDLKLKAVATQGYDYVVSAWVYCENPIKPVITAQLFNAANSSFTTYITQDPVGETFTNKRWQRYEIKITNVQLRVSGSLFATETSGDYLRVRVGTGSPGVSSTRIEYVDDIICRPSQSLATLKAYNDRGQFIQQTTNDHVTSTLEYDFFGNVSAVKDDEGRSFTSTAGHQLGEND